MPLRTELSGLLRNNKLIEVFFNSSNDAILVADVNGNVVNINPAAIEVFKYSKRDFLKLTVDKLYAEKKDQIRVMKSLSENGQFSGRVKNITKNGNVIICYLSATEIKNEEGAIIGSMGISKDITSEIQIQLQQNRLLSSVSEIIYTADHLGNFLYVNDATEKLTGYSSHEIVSKPFQSLIFHEDLERANQHYSRHFKERLKESYLEFRTITKEGKLVWVGQHVTTQFDPVNDNRITGFYGVVRDINDKKEAELQLRDSEEKYRELFDNSTDLIQSINPDGSFNYVNNRWLELLEYTNKEVDNLSFLDIIHQESKHHCQNIFNQIIQTGVCKEGSVLYKVVSKSGNIFSLEGTVSVNKSSERVISIQSFLRNVTGIKETEVKLVKNERTLRQITETLSDVFYLYNVVDKKYEFISPNCASILGCDPSFFYSGESHTQKFGHPEDLEKIYEASLNTHEGMQTDIDYRIIINGQTRWINEKSFPIKNHQGKTISCSGVCRDVTELKEALNTVYHQNLEIGASILYARRLQNAVLPDLDQVNNLFNDAFITYLPKDIVSGDFYVVENIRTNDHQVFPSFFVGDCTGHGIPGAVLSLMCNVLIRESFGNYDVNSPAESLDFVKDKLITFFTNSKGQRIQDGMDASFCVYNAHKQEIYFSGANNSCLVMRDSKFLEFKGCKQHIGFNEVDKPFKNTTIKVKKGDMFFLLSDGYFDQFGGPRDKKFSKKRFQNIVLENATLPMSELKLVLESEFYSWKSSTEQTDDVTIIGVRF